MKTVDDVGRYLALSGHPFTPIGPDTWVVKVQPGDANIAVQFTPPIVLLRMKIMAAPKAGREAFFARLLTMNATEAVHGAFGLEGDDVVLTCALEVENLDPNELIAAVDSFELTWGLARETLAHYA